MFGTQLWEYLSVATNRVSIQQVNIQLLCHMTYNIQLLSHLTSNIQLLCHMTSNIQLLCNLTSYI